MSINKECVLDGFFILFPLSLAFGVNLQLMSLFFILFILSILARSEIVLVKACYKNLFVISSLLFVLVDPFLSYLREGIFYINDTRLSFLFVPAAFCLGKKTIPKKRNLFFISMLIGLISSSIYFIILNLINLTEYTINCFYLSFDIYNQHFTYYSILYTIVFFWVLFSSFNKNLKFVLLFYLLVSSVVFCSKFFPFVLTLLVFIYYRRAILWMAILIVTAIIFKWDFFSRIFSNVTSSLNERINIYIRSIELIKANYINGIGNYNIKSQIIIHNTRDNIFNSYDCHNIFLQEFLANGIIGILSIILLIVSIFIVFKKTKWFYIIIITLLAYGSIEHIFNLQIGVFSFFLILSLLEYKCDIERETSDLNQKRRYL